MAIEKETLGAAIKQVRTVRGMTQVDLAKAAGLSDGGKSLALIEQGRRAVSMETLNVIAEALAIPPGCLAILGSTRIGKNSVATNLMKDLQKLISAVLLAQKDLGDQESHATHKSAKPGKRRKHPKRLVAVG